MKQKILVLFALLLFSSNYVSAQIQPPLFPGQVLPDNMIDDASCFVLPPVQDWSIAFTRSSQTNLSPYQNAVVGDIDNDGIVEILVCADATGGDNAANRRSSKIAIYKGNNISAAPKIITTVQPYSWHNYTKYAIAKTTIGGEETTLIVVAERDYYMRAYDPNSPTPDIPVWTSSERYHASDLSFVTIGFADLNKDGIPEVMIANKIFDSTNGVLLSKTPTEFSAGYSASIPIAEDIFLDGTPRFIQGNMIYKPDMSLTTLTLEKTILASVHASDPDRPSSPPAIPNGGRTSVVDMDLDGQPDLVISVIVGSRTFIYVADPVTGTVKASKIVSGAASSSYPFVGDIDGDGRPEIVFITATTQRMYAYKYVPGNPVLQEFWRLSHSDVSGATAMTLFDFNQDGIFEIVYRDETRLRIINGSLTHHQTGVTPTAPYNLASYACYSNTATEYPVVADVDGDGQAEIIIVGGIGSSSRYAGPLWVFKSGDPENAPWASARKVWNQYAYNSLNINEDLTVPRHPISPATVFSDGVTDTRPFNNFLQQQTKLSPNGTSLWFAANGQISGTPTFAYNEVTYEMVITVNVLNKGAADFIDPFYVTAYKNSVGSNSTKYVYKYENAIVAGGSATVSFSIPNFKANWLPYNSIILKINDKGDGNDDQLVCDNANTQYIYYGILPTEQDLCVGNVKEMTCSFSLGTNDTYQWQSSKNNLTWTDIPGATQNTYHPIDQKPGIVYYRVLVDNNDSNPSNREVIESASVRLRVRSCVLPVNHNISVMGYYD